MGTRLLPEVNWGYHICMLDPDIALIVGQAKAAIYSCQGPTFFYVGVSRYLMRRWLGGDALSFEQAHCSKWARLHVLSTHSRNVGDSEDALIKILRRDLGDSCCANIRNGGGGASRCKPLFVVHMRGAHQIAARAKHLDTGPHLLPARRAGQRTRSDRRRATPRREWSATASGGPKRKQQRRRQRRQQRATRTERKHRRRMHR